MQWNAAGLRPRINFNLHHHGTSFTWHSDGHICDDLRPIVWICVSIQPLRGLTLSIEISQGILGQILEDIRNEFKDADRGQYQQTTPPATNKAASTIANVPTPNQPINNVPDQHECDLHTSDQDTTVNVKNMEVT